MSIKATTTGVRVGDARVKHKTERAMLVVVEGEEHWVPFSQIHDDSEVYSSSEVGETGDLVITEWLAHKLGIGD